MTNRRAMLLVAVVAILYSAAAEATTYWSGPINFPRTMTAAGNPHIVESTLTVALNGVLTIDPGAQVYFKSGAGITVTNGRLDADALGAAPIYFGAYQNTYLTKGFWTGLQFGIIGDESVIRNASINYGGTSTGAAIWIAQSAPLIENVQIRYSAGPGIVVNGTGTPGVLSNVVVEDCQGHGIVVTGAGRDLLLQSDSIIQRNGVNGLGNGLDIRAGARPRISGATIRDNVGYAIGMEPGTAIASLSNLTVSGNGAGTKNAIGYRGGTISTPETWSIFMNLPWHVLATTTVGTGGNLTIPPGQTIYFAPGVYLDVAGRITANGTVAQPILFSSIQAAPGIAPISPPVITATGSSGSVSVTWPGVSGVSSYEVYRKDSAAGAFALRQTVTTNSYADSGVATLTSYVYKVIAVAPGGVKSGNSNLELATTISYTDPVLTPNTLNIKATHIIEVRKAVNALCTLAGTANCAVQPFTGTALDAAFLKTQPVKASDFTSIRGYIESLRATLGVSSAVFRDTVAVNTKRLAIHMDDLRIGAN